MFSSLLLTLAVVPSLSNVATLDALWTLANPVVALPQAVEDVTSVVVHLAAVRAGVVWGGRRQITIGLAVGLR